VANDITESLLAENVARLVAGFPDTIRAQRPEKYLESEQGFKELTKTTLTVQPPG
jgi:hypothetical protein